MWPECSEPPRVLTKKDEAEIDAVRQEQNKRKMRLRSMRSGRSRASGSGCPGSDPITCKWYDPNPCGPGTISARSHGSRRLARTATAGRTQGEDCVNQSGTSQNRGKGRRPHTKRGDAANEGHWSRGEVGKDGDASGCVPAALVVVVQQHCPGTNRWQLQHLMLPLPPPPPQ